MTAPTPGPRTLADQIHACADQLTTATLLDRPAIVAATLRDLAEKVRDTETPNANATVAALHVKQFLDALCIRRSTTGGADDHLIAVETEPGGGPSRELVAGDLRRLLGERNELVLRADRAERERDRQWQLKEIALGALASVRLLAEQIKRYADWPGITDTATYPEIVESLRVCAAGLVRALNAGPRPDGPQRHAQRPAAAETDAEPRQDPAGPQEAAQAAPDRCACGAPAALVVGYRGESGPELQCVRCATNDPRALIGSRDLVNDRGERWWMQEPAQGAALPKAHVHHGRSDTLADCRAEARRDGEPFTVASDPGDPAIDCPRCRLRLASDVLKPEEWCDRYGLIILDPDGWRRPDAPDWNEPVTLGVFYALMAPSTTNAAATGAYDRIIADLARLRAADPAGPAQAATGDHAVRRQQHPGGDPERPAPPACPGCGMPETNCACG